MSWGSTIAWVKYGGLVGKDGWRYSLTPFDVRWAIPAIYGEAVHVSAGEEGDAILWTMANRLYLSRNNRELRRRDGYLLPWPHRLGDIFLAYSQPINPFWRDRGTPFQVERRDRFIKMEPEEFPPGLVSKVIQFAQGRLPMDPRFAGLTDFAACDCEGCGIDVHGEPALRGANCFWRDPGSRSWTVDTIRLVPASGGLSAVVPLAVGVGAAAVFLAVR